MYRIAKVQVECGSEITCFSAEDLALHVGDSCVVQCDKVLEFGRVTDLSEAQGEPRDARAPRVIRRATLQDNSKEQEDLVRSRMARESCVAWAEKHGLEMRIVHVRYSFDRAVLFVQFTAEDRVDFREMVKALSQELRTRLEMKQIGVRDEAALLGGIGPCGRRLCCSSWLNHFESVNVKMAKVQRLSLNPGAISGMCGRLKCCLRYEHESYREHDRRLPRDGAAVECPAGRGRVIDKNVLCEKLRVCLEDGRVVDCPACEARVRRGRPGGARRSASEDTDTKRAESEPSG